MPNLIACLCVALLACGQEVPEGRVPSGLERGDTSLVISSDPELRRMAADLLPTLADRAGLELLRPVRVEERSRAELERYLRAKLENELPPEEAGWIGQSYGLLGLVPPDLDVRDLLLSVYTEQVAGFYDPDSTALFVMDDQSEEDVATVLVHELVHAVQDQSVDLEAMTDPALGNDQRTAAHAAIEGHATLVMIEYVLEQSQGRRIALAELPDMGALMQNTLGSVEDQYPALAVAPRVFQEALLFPYLHGASFVQTVWGDEGRRASVLEEFLPVSTEQVLEPDRLTGVNRDDPVRVGLGARGDERILYTNSLGRLETGIFLESRLGPGGEALAAGWDGDLFALIESPSGEPGLAWAIAWDDVESRDRFISAVAGGLDGLRAPHGVEAAEVNGVPMALVTLGDVAFPPVTVEPWTAAEEQPQEGIGR